MTNSLETKIKGQKSKVWTSWAAFLCAVQVIGLKGPLLTPKASQVNLKIEIYTTRYCGFCINAKRLLSSKGLDFNEIPVDGQSQLRAEASKRAGGYGTVPMIFIDDQFIGGYTELATMIQKGQL